MHTVQSASLQPTKLDPHPPIPKDPCPKGSLNPKGFSTVPAVLKGFAPHGRMGTFSSHLIGAVKPYMGAGSPACAACLGTSSTDAMPTPGSSIFSSRTHRFLNPSVKVAVCFRARAVGGSGMKEGVAPHNPWAKLWLYLHNTSVF